MPTIEFIANVIGRTKVVEAPDGGELVDLSDDALAPIPFSCRSASCGTCHVEVIEGADLLEPAEPRENELLVLLRAGPRDRLACQARVRAGPGRLRVRAVLAG